MKDREEGPTVKVSVSNLKWPHIALALGGLSSAAGLWLHGDATKRGLEEHIEAHRQAIVQDVTAEVKKALQAALDRRLAPLDKKVDDLKVSQDNMRFDVGKLQQAVEDIRQLHTRASTTKPEPKILASTTPPAPPDPEN